MPHEQHDNEQRGVSFLNRNIESFLASGQALELEPAYGIAQLESYLQDLQARAAGVPYSELGIGERRANARPVFLQTLDAKAGTYTPIVSPREVYWNEVRPGSIMRVGLSGVMRAESAASSPGVNSLVSDLRMAYANENIIGIVVETNSGGGESIAGTMLHSAFSERNKPVVMLAHMAASAAYRAGIAADEIIAAGDYAEFGSIGTMITLDNKLIQEYRDRYTDIYGETASGKNADFRAAIEGDLSKLKQKINDLTLSFQDQVKAARPLRGSQKMQTETVSGLMFPAKEAKSRGLIDMIGNMNTAVARIHALRSKY